MVNRLLVWAAGSREVQRQVTENPIARRAAHRFVAGERLEEALAVAAELNSRGVGGILDLLGEGVRDLAGATRAVEEYEEAIAALAARRLDATISIKLSQLGQTVDRDACRANLSHILDTAQSAGVRVEVDMEESGLISDTLKLFREAATSHPQTRARHPGGPAPHPARPRSAGSAETTGPVGQGCLRGAGRGGAAGPRGDQGAVQVPHRLVVPARHRPRVRHPRRRIDRLRARGRRSGGQGAARTSRSSCCTASAATCQRS